MKDSHTNNIAIWGGIECTINRVNDEFIDQLQVAEYYSKPHFLEAILSLGITKFRFPILWERHQQAEGMDIDWRWAASQLEVLKKHNVEPIVGLLHHGSGPSFTNLLKKDFPEKFAQYAAQVAKQFPWVKYYTPINEPLTTARFSGLYGLWYPHHTNDVSFIKILLNELKATVLAMQEIKKINPDAQLIQTEDLAKTYSTPLLSYQAKFENNRRWLTYDILCGKLNEKHPLWNYCLRLGISETELNFFIINTCKPAILGVNYYITSERYLDEELSNYPQNTYGGNTIHSYADIEAVRVKIKEETGAAVLIDELWQRYKIPIAITEVQLHCSREEQIRWLEYIYNAAISCSSKGVNIIAITAWSMLGAFGWNKLLTSFPLNYESGAFDIASGNARPTAVANYIKSLCTKTIFPLSLAKQQGWWQRNTRFINNKLSAIIDTSPQPLLIIGKNGTLGKAFAKNCMAKNIPYVLLGRDEVNICNSESLENVIRKYQPWGIINAAGYVQVDNAEQDKELCYKVNTIGVQKLAILCEKYAIKLMSFSSDLVFDGCKKSPYVESDMPNPLSIYGNSKMYAERFLLNVNPSALIIRTSAFFSPFDSYNFVYQTVSQLLLGNRLYVDANSVVSPTYVPHLVNESLNLFIDNESGLCHLANIGAISWYQLAQQCERYIGINDSLIEPLYNNATVAIRPQYSVLGSEKFSSMPSLEQGLEEYFATTSEKILLQ